MLRRTAYAVLFVVPCLLAARAGAQQAVDSLGADWALERIVLSDGRVLTGLVQSEGPLVVEFVEVSRPRGKPLSLKVCPIDRKLIESWERLPADQQQQLRQRLQQYKRRTLVEGRRMEDLTLSPTSDDGQVLWHYQGNWFTLESTADELMTRRMIVRLGQIFSAYRQLLPPRYVERGRVRVRIFGSTDQYRAALEEQGLSISNPAVYLADKNLILTGSELDRFDAQLDQVNKQHRQVKAELDAVVADAQTRIKQLSEDLKKNQVPAAERLRIVLAEQRKWDAQRRAIQQKIVAVERRNATRFNEMTDRMFTRLAHEALHAYLESYVYPRAQYDVPRWLNEGLAQTFEAGRLELDSLRIDTPNSVALTKLQEDLRSDKPLSLKELLTAGGDTFLAAHRDGQTVPRAYYYSWGLAYYLAFELGVLGTPALDAYLDPKASGSPVERFERLIGMPLDRFEKQWREAMLAMRPA